MNEEVKKERGVTSGDPPKPGVANYPPQQQHAIDIQGVPDHPPKPVTGHPQSGPPPPATTYASAPPPPPQFYADGNQAAPGYPVSEGTPAVREHDRLFCCGLGLGWFMFILGFILGVIPWYIGAIMLFFVKRKNYRRERPGYIACAVFAVIGTVLIIVEVTTKFRFYN